MSDEKKPAGPAKRPFRVTLKAKTGGRKTVKAASEKTAKTADKPATKGTDT